MDTKYKKIIAAVCIVGLLAFIYPHIIHASYQYSRAITIQGSQVPSTQTNFTVLVCANGASPCNTSVSGLNQTGAGAHVANANGDDIIFTSDSSCTSKLNWEMEDYVPSTGEMEAWVLIPSLTTSNQTMYMCYGNSAISTFQGGATGSAWDSNYGGVYHLPNGSSLSANDSTSNGNNGTVVGSVPATSGQIDGAGSFSGSSSNYIDIGNSSTLTNATAFTISTWIYITAYPSVAGIIFARDNSTSGQRGYDLDIDPAGKPSISIFQATDAESNIQGGSTMSLNTWYYVTMTYQYVSSGSSILTDYINGVGNDSVSTANGPDQTPTNDTYIGKRQYSGFDNPFTGSIDEVRFSNIVRSADWIKTEYNNQSSPSTFETFGSEIAVPVIGSTHQFTFNNNHTALFTGSHTFILQ
jgi:hypothetical protein